MQKHILFRTTRRQSITSSFRDLALDEITFLVYYNSAIITASIPFGIYLMKKIGDLCTYKVQQEQKEIDKEKYGALKP